MKELFFVQTSSKLKNPGVNDDRKCIVFLCALVLKCLRQVVEELHLYYYNYKPSFTYKWPPKVETQRHFSVQKLTDLAHEQ